MIKPLQYAPNVKFIKIETDFTIDSGYMDDKDAREHMLRDVKLEQGIKLIECLEKHGLFQTAEIPKTRISFGRDYKSRATLAIITPKEWEEVLKYVNSLESQLEELRTRPHLDIPD